MVIPSLVGCDIGCGMEAIHLQGIDFSNEKNLQRLDMACHRDIKSGFDIWDKPHSFAAEIEDELKEMIAPIDFDKAMRSIGSLGSGNHFIELNKSEDGTYWLVIHTGSRHLGLEVEGYYTKLAETSEGSQFAAVKGQAFEDYIHDMRIAQKFASINRQAISRQISDSFKFCARHIVGADAGIVETIHNYIDLENMIVRKGAIRLSDGELAIIPMNMADGSLIVRGKGNVGWNQSGPHGAGRLMSRGQARRTLTMEDFKDSMKGIYSTTVCKDTIDESKMAYKPMKSIIDAIKDTCEIVEIVKPVYNFKAAEKRHH
jgi:RNA-splicing ligase RtcB